MAKESMTDAKQASKNGMPLSPVDKKHPKPFSKHQGRKSSRKG